MFDESILHSDGGGGISQPGEREFRAGGEEPGVHEMSLWDKIVLSGDRGRADENRWRR